MKERQFVDQSFWQEMLEIQLHFFNTKTQISTLIDNLKNEKSDPDIILIKLTVFYDNTGVSWENLSISHMVIKMIKYFLNNYIFLFAKNLPIFAIQAQGFL